MLSNVTKILEAHGRKRLCGLSNLEYLCLTVFIVLYEELLYNNDTNHKIICNSTQMRETVSKLVKASHSIFLLNYTKNVIL